MKKEGKRSKLERNVNGNAFSKLDLEEYSGKTVIILKGKVVFNDTNPSKAMKEAMKYSKKNKVALVCVPSCRTTMVV